MCAFRRKKDDKKYVTILDKNALRKICLSIKMPKKYDYLCDAKRKNTKIQAIVAISHKKFETEDC